MTVINLFTIIIQKIDTSSMKALSILLAVAALALAAQSAVKHLSDRNFLARVNEAPFTLVYFYSSGCKFCQEFTPKFEKLSKSPPLLNLSLAFAKIDSPTYQNFTYAFKVYSYPTIALFTKGVALPVFYRKEREVQPIAEFVLKTVRSFESLKVAEQLAKLTPEQAVGNKYALFRGRRDSAEFKLWDVIAKRDGYIEWAFVEDASARVEIGAHQLADFSDAAGLEEQVEAIYARVHRITEESWLKLVDKKRFSIVYINKHGNRKTRQLLERLAQEFGNVHFLEIDNEEEDYKEAVRFLGMNDEENIIAVDKAYDAVYVAPAPYSEAGLRQFIEQAREHKLELYRKTESSEKPNKLTRANYEARMATSQDVLLFLYDRKEQISKELMNLFEFLLLKLRDNKHLLLLRCDVKLNEVEEKLGFLVKSTPRLVFFRNRQKDYPIHFQGKTISTRTVLDFIMENTTFDFEDAWAEL